MEGAVSATPGSPSAPGLDVGGSAAGCDTVTGPFDILSAPDRKLPAEGERQRVTHYRLRRPSVRQPRLVCVLVSSGGVATVPPGLEMEWVSPDDLFFDERNPRLTARGDEASTQDEILLSLWRDFAVDELALSLAANGYFQYDPLFVAEEVLERGGDEPVLVVIEGNRRLAAVKLLLSAELRRKVKATDLPAASRSVRQSLKALPAVRCERDEIWRFVGFKHVNGPQQWDALSKAEYIAWVHNQLGEPLRDIANQIGDRHSTVQRLYNALMALTQAEKESVFDREHRYNKRFFFSHLYTGLGYKGIQSYVGLGSSKSERGTTKPIPKTRLDEFGLLCTWLFGDKEKAIPPLVKRQNPDLRLLDEALQTRSGVTALERGLPLTVALDIAKGDDRILREALVGAKTTLQTAKARVVTGYSGEPELFSTAQDILLLAESILDEMTSMDSDRPTKTRPRRR